jgi:hypothetical protein
MRRVHHAVGGKAPSDIPALEPDRGKLAVRNLRGDDGNGGIIRSPIRAIALPDPISTHTRRTSLRQWVERYVQPRVDRRKHGRMREQSYDPIVPAKVGDRRAPETGGHGTHWREGGSKRTNLLKGDIARR